MCESGSVRALVAAPLPAAVIPSLQLRVSWPLRRACWPSPLPLHQLLHPWGCLGAGGRGCFYLPLEQGRRLKLKDAEKSPAS